MLNSTQSAPARNSSAAAALRTLQITLLLLPTHSLHAQFIEKIQPILASKCHSCHGPALQQGNLRLDSKSAAAKVLHPGDAASSLLYLRITGQNNQPRMPLGGAPLTNEQIAGIKAWIDSGATWPESPSAAPGRPKHWAFFAPKRPPVPKVSTPAWPKNPIDNFILARLGAEKLQPSAPADRITLLRRASLDVIGLPPTPAEVDAFLGDTSPNAYAKQIDRLLASPHYGERWGRLWLDAARYADSDGYEKDKPRFVWFYRDWVINSLNRDLPYNQFITEQLAGDLLPNPTQDQRVATGFLRNSMINEEGGVDPEQFRMEAMFDRMDALGKSMLGLTIQCAQCHNHKYDPFSQEDYYRVFAFLNDSHEANIAVYDPFEQRKRAQVFQQIRQLEIDLRHRNPDWPAKMAAWERKYCECEQPIWTVIRPEVDDISNGGQKYLPLPDGSFLAQGYAPTKHKVKMSAKIEPGHLIAAVRLELLNDPNLPFNGPGRSIKGAGALTEFEAEAILPSAAKPEKIKISKASADINLPETPLDPMFYDRSNKHRVTGPIEFAIDGKDETAWGHDAGPVLRNLPRKAVFTFEKPVYFEKGGELVIYLNQRHGGWNSDDNQNNNLGRIRLSTTDDPSAVADPVPAHIRDILNAQPAKRSAAQTQALFSEYRLSVPEWKSVNGEIAALWKQHPEGASQLVLQRQKEVRSTHLLTRGDFLKPGREVDPGVPSFLNPLPPGAPPNRLTLARWLTDRNAPTTARSFVNRVWQAYFGTGIVATSEDLGTQSEPPSHPELLDWLAVEFMEKGWSQKQLHKLIVTSSTYTQSSKVTPELYSRDPYNRLLSRGPRFRVDAEIVRDIALAASGLLNRRIGGHSVFAPAPDFLFQPPASYGPKIWKEAAGPDRYRRALYTFRYRSVPYPMLQTFDAPNGDFACVRRVRSNTPLQALVTLNEPLFLEAAKALASLTLKSGGSTEQQRIAYAFRRCLSRPPSPNESRELQSFLERQKARFDERQSYTALARVLLNLDETITKE